MLSLGLQYQPARCNHSALTGVDGGLRTKRQMAGHMSLEGGRLVQQSMMSILTTQALTDLFQECRASSIS